MSGLNPVAVHRIPDANISGNVFPTGLPGQAECQFPCELHRADVLLGLNAEREIRFGEASPAGEEEAIACLISPDHHGESPVAETEQPAFALPTGFALAKLAA